MIGAVDIGGTKIAAGVVDGRGQVVASAECPTYSDGGFDSAMERVASMLSEASREAGAAIEGIGIGCTGPVDPVTGALGNVNFFPAWEGSNPVAVLSHRFGVRVAMENDADAAALGEAVWGTGKGKSRLIFVTVGTGIGGGIILDGRIYRGVDASHPEIGHHVIDPSGPACSCGARGCWESFATGPALAGWYSDNAPAAGLTAKEICRLADQGDELARRAADRTAFYLGIGLANLVSIFAPDAIVLGGSVMKSAHLFLDKVRDVVRENCRLVPYKSTLISLSSLGADAGLVGAAEVWRHRFTRAGGQA